MGIDSRRAVAALLCIAGTAVWAQTPGRTDGPEGSEVGKGGYVPAPGGKSAFSLQIDFGGLARTDGSTPTPPLFLGLTGTYWAEEFYRLDLSGQYLWGVRRWQALFGPSFRTVTWPVSFSIGLQVGAMFPEVGSVYFLISPRMGVDLIVESHFQLGLGVAYDMAMWEPALFTFRGYIDIGWRF
jgi:hypothetical protein